MLEKYYELHKLYKDLYSKGLVGVSDQKIQLETDTFFKIADLNDIEVKHRPSIEFPIELKFPYRDIAIICLFDKSETSTYYNNTEDELNRGLIKEKFKFDSLINPPHI